MKPTKYHTHTHTHTHTRTHTHTHSPPLFTNIISQAFNLQFLLSTSQTPVRTTDRWRLECSSVCGGFGTVTDNGYGISYIVYDEHGKEIPLLTFFKSPCIMKLCGRDEFSRTLPTQRPSTQFYVHVPYLGPAG